MLLQRIAKYFLKNSLDFPGKTTEFANIFIKCILKEAQLNKTNVSF